MHQAVGRRTIRLAAAALMASALSVGSAHAGNPVNTGYFGGVAIMGYDTVAYFTDHKAMKGKEELAYDWLGTPWHFATPEHRDLFVADPLKYAPQYGGYCVGEVVFNGITINIDPEAWRSSTASSISATTRAMRPSSRRSRRSISQRLRPTGLR